MIALYIIFSLLISIFNAWSVGRSWIETKAVGGFARFMAWMGAVMSAIGFSWCYLILIALAAGPDGFNKLKPEYIEAMVSLGYLAIIVPLIGSGLAITIDSWAYFWRKKTFGRGALAGYNTFADIYNIYEASRFVPKALDSVRGLFKKDSDSKASGLVLLLVGLALLAGVLTTAAIIRTVSQVTARNRRFAYESQA